MTRTKMVGLALVLGAIVAGHPASAAPDAKQILQKMDAAMTQAFTKSKSYQATITKTEQSGPGSASMKLHLRMLTGKKVRAEVSMTGGPAGPQSMQFVDDGAAQYMYQPKTNTYTKMPSGAAQSGPMIAMMSGIPIGMTREMSNIKASIVGSQAVGGKPAYRIVATPVKPSPRGITRAELTVDKTTNRLRLVTLTQGKGRATVTIANELLDQPIPANVFKFVPPPGAKLMQPGVAAPGRPGPPKPR
jgi:outer membrane lipoprotein-sorting protein